MQFCIDREIRCVERYIREVCHDHWRAHRHGAGFNDVHRSPEPHIFIRGTRIPIDPVDAEILFCWCGGFDGEDIRFARSDNVGDIEIIGAICARHRRRVGDPVAVDPDLAPIVDTAEVQPEAVVFRCKCRRGEFFTVPPAAGVGAVCWHGQIGKVMAGGIACPGNLSKVVAKVRIRKDPGLDLRGKYRAWNRSLKPTVGLVLRSRDRFARSSYLARRLQLPIVAQRSCFFPRQQSGQEEKGKEENGRFRIHWHLAIFCARAIRS